MSRCVLLPGQSKNQFVLVSTENLNQAHTVELPEELYDMNIFNNVTNRNTANNLLYRICKSEISKTMDVGAGVNPRNAPNHCTSCST